MGCGLCSVFMLLSPLFFCTTVKFIMALFEHSKKFENAVLFSRFDLEHPLATVSSPGFELEGRAWPTAEHYYQFSKQKDAGYAEKILQTPDPLQANKMGNQWLRRKRPDFKTVRILLMTRALYSKAIQNQEVKEFLLDTEDKLIAEVSQYDPFWGISRDQRGLNQLGKVWMDIRAKIRESA